MLNTYFRCIEQIADYLFVGEEDCDYACTVRSPCCGWADHSVSGLDLSCDPLAGLAVVLLARFRSAVPVQGASAGAVVGLPDLPGWGEPEATEGRDHR